MGLLNILPLPQGPSIAGLAGDQVQEIVTTYNIESLDAVNAAVDKDNLWSFQGTRVTPAIGKVKVPIRFLGQQSFTPFKPGGQRDMGSIDVGAITIPTSMNQLNYAWAMIADETGKMHLLSVMADGTYEEFYGGAGLAEAIIIGGHDHRANLVASVVYESMTSSSAGLTATMLGIAENGYPNGLPLFTNGITSPKHKAHPMRSDSALFETLFEPSITNRVGFIGGAFDSTWLEKMTLAMTQVPHPSRPNRTMGLEVTDIVGPTWMKIPFWRAAVQNLQLQTATVGATGIGAATTNIFNAKLVEEMGADKFIGAGGVAPQRYWTTSLLDNHPYALAHLTDGPGGGPAHFCMSIANMKPGVQNWCELAARDKDFTPFVHFYGPGDPRAMSERQVRLLGDLDAGARPGLAHFVAFWMGV